MKKIFISFIVGILCLITNVVVASAIECNYTVIATVDEKGNYTGPTIGWDIAPEDKEWTKDYWIKLDSYNSGTSSSSYIGGDEDLLNWDNKDYCPNIIRLNPSSNVKWYGYENLDDAKTASHNDRYTGLFNDGGDYNDYDIFFIYDQYLQEQKESVSDFDTATDYTCEYDDFKINFNKDGYALTAEYTGGLDNTIAIFFYNLSEEMRNGPSPVPGECQDVHYCLKSSAVSSIPTNTYLIFADDFDYNANKDQCQEGGLFTGSYHTGTDSYDNGCRTYMNYIDSLKIYWDSCKQDVGLCGQYNIFKEEISGICNSLMEYADFNNDCLQDCLNYKKEVLEIERETNETPECGFSDRILNFVGNIMKWIKYIMPVLVILFGILDFIKAISGDKDEEMKKAQGKFVKRLISAALVFIIPFIIEFVLDKMGFVTNGCGIIDL